MKWNRISVKLGATIISLLLIVLLPLGFVIDKIVADFNYGQVKEAINDQSSRYASALSSSPHPMMTNMIEMMAEFSGQKLYVVNKKGEIIANANIPGLPVGSTIPEEEVNSLLNEFPSSGEYEHSLSGQRFLVSGHPIHEGDSFIGNVFVLSSVESIDQSIFKLRQMFILSGVGAFFLALGVTLVLSRKLSNPLLRMEHATRKIARGDLETRVVITGDETGSLAQAINDLAIDLKRYRDTRREFFANISHELRTPITYLEGYANVVKKGLYQNEEEKVKYLDIIETEAKHLSRLIEDLFELSKLEEGKINLNQEPIDLEEVLDNVQQRIALKAKEKEINLGVEIRDEVSFVYGDGLRMEQIFHNLLNNAIKYTDKGVVNVTLSRELDHYVLVVIEDTGKGIPEEDLPYIFERFSRVEKSRSREHGGTGLGLAIVKQLVELQKGKIQVTSQLGAGTRFEIKFPSMKEG
ncbi:sensor histidine kinase [Bacillus solitudinis]|uniref:sensor histidine kinase n=1 Tax=Bacillus solitudinis TaxID=2014074 RepID=UPI000C23F937|nr:HAMP domain-containing sensor histidine kinase [Bacillus solitudinis]